MKKYITVKEVREAFAEFKDTDIVECYLATDATWEGGCGTFWIEVKGKEIFELNDG